jgi:hypothetical protein
VISWEDSRSRRAIDLRSNSHHYCVRSSKKMNGTIIY